jgi:hypothetical protein
MSRSVAARDSGDAAARPRPWSRRCRRRSRRRGCCRRRARPGWRRAPRPCPGCGRDPR